LRSFPLIVTALAIGIIAAAWSLISGKNDIGDAQTIVVATTDIPPGVPITANQLTTAQWPMEILSAGSFRKTGLVVGRVARQPFTANEPILESRLAPRDSRGGLSSLIAPGKRAISVRVDEVIGVAGFALPGSFVDVMVSARDASSAPFSKIVLSRVKVLASEQDTAGDPTQPKVVRAVTLELGPQDAEKLDLARSVGSLSLVLRNEMDAAETVSAGVWLNNILPGAGNRISTAAVAADPPANAQNRVTGVGTPVPVSNASRKGRAINTYGAEEIRGVDAASREGR